MKDEPKWCALKAAEARWVKHIQKSIERSGQIAFVGFVIAGKFSANYFGRSISGTFNAAYIYGF